jgi:hypothetical protein
MYTPTYTYIHTLFWIKRDQNVSLISFKVEPREEMKRKKAQREQQHVVVCNVTHVPVGDYT